MEPVRTHRAKSVVDAARLHRAIDRRQRGLTLVEGPELLADVTAAGARLVEWFALEGSAPVDVPGQTPATPVDERALSRLSGTRTPRGPIGVVEIPVEWMDRSKSLVVSVGVSDPGNVGTMIRTAAAFGWGFAYMEGSADPWSPKTVRAGAGGQFQTAVARVGSIAELDHWVSVAAVPKGGSAPSAISDRPVAVLIGEEASGLDDWVIAAADHRMTITTPGITESLNAAVAAGIAVYALSDEAGGEHHRV